VNLRKDHYTAHRRRGVPSRVRPDTVLKRGRTDLLIALERGEPDRVGREMAAQPYTLCELYHCCFGGPHLPSAHAGECPPEDPTLDISDV
jgi:hypothetical protein